MDMVTVGGVDYLVILMKDIQLFIEYFLETADVCFGNPSQVAFPSVVAIV